MKFNIYFKHIVIAGLVAIFVYGCSAKRERDIVGTWHLVPVTDNNDSILWSFYDGGYLFIENNGHVGDSGSYTLTTNVLEYYVDLTDFCPDPDSVADDINFHISNCRDGRYKIDLLNESFLKLQRIANGDGTKDATFMYLEFEKSR